MYMNILIFIFLFLIGTFIGSFLNVVIFRFNTGMAIVNSRSICMSCNKQLRWYELIPLFSFLIQKGKCRRCASVISHQYPLVEFITGLVLALVVFKFMPIYFISYWSYIFFITYFIFIFSLLIVISVYDLRHKIIPNKLVYIFIVLSFFSIFIDINFTNGLFRLPSIINIFSGLLLSLPFGMLSFFSKEKLMGFGDAKLILGIGYLLGFYFGLSAVVLAFWFGSIIGILLIILSKMKKLKKVNMKTEIPFAPFLIFSTFIVFILNLHIETLIKFLQIK